MKLLTKQLTQQFKTTGRQEWKKDHLVIARYFCPWNARTRYATEYDPEAKEFFGYVDGLDAERGYFSLTELESLDGPFGLTIERDMHFNPQLCSALWLPTFDYKEESPMEDYDPCMIPEMQYASGEAKYCF